MIVFTWNLNRSDFALRLALDHLKQCALGDSVLATLQELPPKSGKGSVSNWKLPPQLEPVSLASNGLRLYGPVGPGRLVILASIGVMDDGKTWQDTNERVLYVHFRETQPFAAMAIHALDRSNPDARTEFQRGSHAALTRRQIDEIRDPARPFILFGDLNAAPTDGEITLREGFFFRSEEELKDVTAGMRAHYGTASPPFENLMRRIDGDALQKTYYWSTSGLRYNYDQIIVTEDLGSTAGDPAVLQQISATSLLTGGSKKRPNKKYSDHLPVQVTITL